MRCIVQVALPLPLFRTFSYVVPESLLGTVQVGSTVEVDFHNRIVTGWVVREGGEEVPGLKEIRAVEPLPPLPVSFLAFLQRLSVLYLTPLGEIIALVMPPLRKSYRSALSLRVFVGENNVAFRERFDTLSPRGMNGFLFREQFRISECEWQRLLVDGVIRVEPERWIFEEIPQSPGTFSFWEIPRMEERKAFFAENLKKAQREGQKILVLFPDFEREDTFLAFLHELLPPSRIVRYDSRLSARERLKAFLRIVEGDFTVIAGTRLAAFVFPRSDLRLCVLFDPEEKGYFPDRTPRYSTAEVLEERIRFFGGHLDVVGSVPSLRAYFQWKQGILRLGNTSSSPSRVAIQGIVVQKKLGRCALLPPARLCIEKVLRRGGVVLVWVQKTGYAGALGCRECGFYYTCPSCGIALRYHQDRMLLVCPLCRSQRVPESTCPVCGGVEWEEWGQGTERVFEEVVKAFPGVHKERVDPENDEEGWGSVVQVPSILVGTNALLRESLLAKASLFVVHSLDEWLGLPEVGAQEEFYLRLHRVIRLLPEGAQIIVQGSRQSLSRLSDFLKPWSSFYAPLLEKRRALSYPPFTRLVRIVARARNKVATMQVLSRLKELFMAQGIQVLGPFPSVRPRRGRTKSVELIIRYPDEDAEKVFALCSQVFPLSGMDWSFEPVLF